MVVWATGSQTVPNWRPCRQNRSPTSAARTIWPTAPWIFNAVCYFAIKSFLCHVLTSFCTKCIIFGTVYLLIHCSVIIICLLQMQLKSFVLENTLKLGFPRVFSRFCFIMTLSCNNVTAELLQYISETRSGMFCTSSVNK